MRKEQFFFDLISGTKKGLFYDTLRACLKGLSWIFGAVVCGRAKLYQFGIIKSFRPLLPTISVGNIVVGGTGKTPFTIWLAKKLAHKNPAILLRGYRGKKEKRGAKVSSFDASRFGDEAVLLAKRVPEAQIFVGKKRKIGAKLAAQEGAKLLLLDDGFQHHRVKRDLNFVLIDATNPFGYGHLLPRGLLREPLKNLQRADCIVINRAEIGKNYTLLENEIRHYCPAPIAYSRLVVDSITDLFGQKREMAQFQKVALFCAIGAPHGFVKQVEELGFEVTNCLFGRDHSRFSENDLRALWQESQKKGATALLCTEKDSVKLTPSQLPIFSVNVKLDLFQGQELVDKMLSEDSLWC